MGQAAIKKGKTALKLLCVDDNSTTCRMVDLMLAATGIDVDFVNDGQAAVEAYQANEYDAVVMDLEMPVMSGLQAAREIRQMEDGFHLSYTPILFLSDRRENIWFDQGVEAGGDGHLLKPFTSEALISALDRVLRAANRAGLQGMLTAGR